MKTSVNINMSHLYDNIKNVNDSKFFAGMIILLLNISSKFITLPIPKTVESYIKHNFSSYILVFAISWMGTRDVFPATIVTCVFIILMGFIFNEESYFCCLPEGFVTEQMQRLDENNLSKNELEDAIKVFDKAKLVLENTLKTK